MASPSTGYKTVNLACESDRFMNFQFLWIVCFVNVNAVNLLDKIFEFFYLI